MPNLQNRCPEVKPDTDAHIQCIHTATTSHKVHSGWLGDVRHEWHDAPKGPKTNEEYAAAAWEMTGALGLKMHHDKIYDRVVIDREQLAEWWDGEDRTSLVKSYKESLKES